MVSEEVVPSVPGNNHIRRMTSESCSKGFIRAIGDRTASETLVMQTQPNQNVAIDRLLEQVRAGLLHEGMDICRNFHAVPKYASLQYANHDSILPYGACCLVP